MATGKTARSRSTRVQENGTKLEDGLNAFKSDKFDADGYVQSKCSLNQKVGFDISMWNLLQILTFFHILT